MTGVRVQLGIVCGSTDHGALVEVVRYMPRRWVLVRHEGRLALTFTYCLAPRPKGVTE